MTKPKPSDDSATETSREAKRRERRERRAAREPTLLGKFAFLALRILLITILVGGLLLWYTYQSAQHVPEFYQAVLDQNIEQLDNAGDQFESNVLELQNSTQRSGQWQFSFTQDEINGWLAVDLPKKFPKALPQEVSDPRIAITDGEMKFACRFNTRRIKGIVVASADVFSTENRNEIALRIKGVKSGIIPLPVAPYADKISQSLRKSAVPISWTEIEGDPVALITLPNEMMKRDDQNVTIESLHLEEGQLVISGITGALPMEPANPTESPAETTPDSDQEIREVRKPIKNR